MFELETVSLNLLLLQGKPREDNFMKIVFIEEVRVKTGKV